jgi:hypothetical protein
VLSAFIAARNPGAKWINRINEDIDRHFLPIAKWKDDQWVMNHTRVPFGKFLQLCDKLMTPAELEKYGDDWALMDEVEQARIVKERLAQQRRKSERSESLLEFERNAKRP